ncbi:MAG: type I-C CRISPR-associated protein Cas7/Csd2 [Dehalococcoidia bacterium]|nr:type I-C CRISPR-associated protein Cas7/Csd2 [Dehalococcoidia bacterium]
MEVTTMSSLTPSSPHIDPTKRHDFIVLFDVTDGNPNGDPDAGNAPRIDPETGQGLVTDVSIKRKVRDWINAQLGNTERYKIYVESGVALNAQHQRAYTALGLKSTGAKQEAREVDRARQWMCENFFDIRMFGAVMTTGVNCGQVRGPLQMTFARSIDPILTLDVTITRVAITKQEDMTVAVSDEGEGRGGKRTEIGRKAIVPYGLYRAYGFFNPFAAEATGVTADDLRWFWDALTHAWELDRSSSRGMMACRGIYVFSHTSKLGNAPAHMLFDRVAVARATDTASPRSFNDYRITVRGDDLPDGVSLTILATDR